MADMTLSPEVIAAIARATAAKTERENPRMATTSASVVASAAGASPGGFPILTVHIDGDAPGVTTPVVSLAGDRGVGARVTVMFTPPHGALAIGGAESIPFVLMNNTCGGDPPT